MAEEKKTRKRPETMEEVFAGLKKIFKKDSDDIFFDPNKKYEIISTGNLMMDFCSGIGGFPKGRIIEVVAMESTGKTALLYNMIGGLQRAGGVSVLLDFEQSCDPEYIYRVFHAKVDNGLGNTFIVFTPTCIEEGAEILDAYVNSDVHVDLFAVDSIETMKPRAMIEGSMDEAQRLGMQASAVSKFFNKLRVGAFRKNFCAVATNQIRNQISIGGVFAPTPAGIASGYKVKGNTTTPGGLTPRFLASMRFEMTYKTDEKEEEFNIGSAETKETRTTKIINIMNVKNKCARPGMSGITYFDFATDTQVAGWNPVKDAWDTLIHHDIINNTGRKYTYKSEKLEWNFSGAGDDAKKDFAKDPERVQELVKAFKLLTAVKHTNIAPTSLCEYKPSQEALLGNDVEGYMMQGKEVSLS